NTYLITSRGEQALAITRVNGADRVEHIAGLLRMAGVNLGKVYLAGTPENYYSLYMKRFAEMGYVPDQVVFGFPISLLKHFFSKITDEARQHDLQARLLEVQTLKRAENSLLEHELINQQFLVLQLKDGKKIWFFNNEYGDRAADLVSALQDFGVK